jgi:hypothetical protein
VGTTVFGGMLMSTVLTFSLSQRYMIIEDGGAPE